MPPHAKVSFVDTNVLLRYLMADDPAQSPRAAAFMEEVQVGAKSVEVIEGVLIETVWTLESFFGVPRSEICSKLTALLSFPGVRMPGKTTLLDALARYRDSRADFVDCLLASRAVQRGGEVITFDETDFRKLGGAWRVP